MTQETTLPLSAPALSSRSIGVLMLVGASVLWSLSGLAVKLAQMAPVPMAGYRSLATAVAIGLILPFTTGRHPPIKWMALSIAIFTVVVTLLITAMTYSTAAMGILLQYTAPVFCALLAWIFQRRRISNRTMIAMIIATGGVLTMILGAPRGESLIGPISGALSGVAFGALILVLEKIDRECDGKANPFLIVVWNNVGCAVLLLALCMIMNPIVPASAQAGKPAPFALTITSTQLAIVALTGVIQLGIPYILFQLAIRRVHPVDACLLILLEPVLNPLWVALVTPERPDLWTYVGGAAILVALLIEAVKPNEAQKKPATQSDPPNIQHSPEAVR